MFVADFSPYRVASESSTAVSSGGAVPLFVIHSNTVLIFTFSAGRPRPLALKNWNFVFVSGRSEMDATSRSYN